VPPSAAPDTAAGRASQLTAPANHQADELKDTAELHLEGARRRHRRGPRPLLVVLAGAVAFAVLATAGWLWAQTQYYVGAHNQRVAIFQGLNQPLFGLPLSHVEEETNLQLCRLSPDLEAQVIATLPAADKQDARKKVETLRQQALANQPKPSGTAPPTQSPTPGATVSPNQTVSPTPQASPGATPTPPGTTAQADRCGPAPGPTPSPGSPPASR